VYSNAIVNSGASYFTISFTDNVNATLPNTGAAIATNLGQTATYNETGGTLLKVIYTPTVNQQVKLRLTASNTAATPLPSGSYVKVTQLGSSATTGLNLNLTTTGSGASTSTLNIPNVINDQAASGFIDIGNTRIQWGRSLMGVGLT
ncbi:hypothetical protein, partial [Mycobacterium tuberculosis]|uniref:hypothetical protein n=1 Tax=Mycobacterium tuberculosis TaxID=1773 RepID=UPI00131F17ED